MPVQILDRCDMFWLGVLVIAKNLLIRKLNGASESTKIISLKMFGKNYISNKESRIKKIM
jgi:hypothetical protein